MGKFFDELKRRNVIKETIAYIVVGWVFLQVSTLVLGIFEAPSWVSKSLTVILALGLPLWVLVSWTYQVTTEGLKKTKTISAEQVTTGASNKRLDILIILSLIAAIVVTFVNKPVTPLSSNANFENDLALNNSIAVLPFLDMSPNKDQEYLSDGIAEEILNRLCKFKDLKVKASTSSFSFKNKNEDIKTIGEILDAKLILEGSVRKIADRIMISVRLTNSAEGNVLLSESYSDDLPNIFELQSNIATDIAKKIGSKLDVGENRLLNRSKINPEAYETYLKGRAQFVNGPLNMKGSEIARAKNYFEAAIIQDTTFAEAYAYLAMAYFNLADWVLDRKETTKIERALDSAELLSKKALHLDSLSSGAHLAMGSYYFHQYRWLEAENAKRKAVELNPGGTEEKFILASFLGQFGQAEEALRLDEEALNLDPLDVNSKLKYVRDLYRARQYDRCIQQCEVILEEEPNSTGALQFLYLAYSGKKQFEEAGKLASKLYELMGHNELANIYASYNYKAAISKILSDVDAPTSKTLIGGLIQMAILYAEIEDKDNTFNYLESIYKNKLPQISFLSQHMFDFLRDDPRYMDLFEKAGFQAYYEAKEKKSIL